MPATLQMTIAFDRTKMKQPFHARLSEISSGDISSSVTIWLDYFSLFGFPKYFKFDHNVQLICQSRFKILSKTK